MLPVITAFAASPDRGRGLARDMRIRWALEEIGMEYHVRYLSFDGLKRLDHLGKHPFGQIPTFEQDGLVLFESGAIVLHIADLRPGHLLSDNPVERARAVSWVFAALNTIEPPILERASAVLLERDEPWFEARLPLVDERVIDRLEPLSVRLGGAEWLERQFSAGDLMMITVLRRLESSGLLDQFPSLAAYIKRGEVRPAYKAAFEAQLAQFRLSQHAE